MMVKSLHKKQVIEKAVMKQSWYIFFLLLTFLLAACGQSESISMTKIDAELALIASNSPTASLQPISTSTMTPTATLLPTETLSPTATRATFTQTPYPPPTAMFSSFVGCSNSEHVKDVTIPDGTIVAPGETFKKTWRLKNTGTCPWTKNYSINFIRGNSLGGETTTINKYVEPDKTADITISLTAPDVEGVFIGYWLLADQNGIGFGQLIYVQVIISSEK